MARNRSRPVVRLDLTEYGYLSDSGEALYFDVKTGMREDEKAAFDALEQMWDAYFTQARAARAKEEASPPVPKELLAKQHELLGMLVVNTNWTHDESEQPFGDVHSAEYWRKQEDTVGTLVIRWYRRQQTEKFNRALPPDFIRASATS